MKRCPWCGDDPLMIEYHDSEWGVPQHDPRSLFEGVILDGFQAGLSWITVLRKREAFRRAFHGFDPERIARYRERDIKRLLSNAAIIRHRGKIEATISGARAWLRIEERQGFASFLWDFVDGVPKVNRYRSLSRVPDSTPVSKAMAQALHDEGFRFVGPTSVYAFMQGAGLVNDHLVSCPRHRELAGD